MAILGENFRFIEDADEDDDFIDLDDAEDHPFLERAEDRFDNTCDYKIRLTGSKTLHLPMPHRCSS